MNNLHKLNVRIGCARFWLHKAIVDKNDEMYRKWNARLNDLEFERSEYLNMKITSYGFGGNV